MRLTIKSGVIILENTLIIFPQTFSRLSERIILESLKEGGLLLGYVCCLSFPSYLLIAHNLILTVIMTAWFLK